MSDKRTYIAFDLKSFYASVECIERGLDPLRTNLVVADASRTNKTICLAVSPSLKAYGVSGRARLFEVVQKVRYVNARRLSAAPGRIFRDKSYDADALASDPSLELSYITAIPRMALYVDYSTRVYNVYLKYVAPEDIHVYSIDEVFMDVTAYLEVNRMTAYEFAQMIIQDVLKTTGVTATAGIGSNLYLAKIAMDIVAKHVTPDKYGVRIAELDELTYRKKLWDHRPLTDFWRVGKGYARKLEDNGLFTMGDIARCSIGKTGEFHNEDLLYKLFGVNAELLIDHAWGWEPCTLSDIKAYKPVAHSIGSGQVLHDPYEYDKARIVVREMTDMLVLDLVDKKFVTNQVTLTVGYDIENLTDPERRKKYKGPVQVDGYGRRIPKHAHGTVNFDTRTSSTKIIVEGVLELFDNIINKDLLIRRINMSANNVLSEELALKEDRTEQLSIFDDLEKKEKLEQDLEREKQVQHALLDIKKKFGKNAILKGVNLQEGATAQDRNRQIGGHKA